MLLGVAYSAWCVVMVGVSIAALLGDLPISSLSFNDMRLHAPHRIALATPKKIAAAHTNNHQHHSQSGVSQILLYCDPWYRIRIPSRGPPLGSVHSLLACAPHDFKTLIAKKNSDSVLLHGF